MHDMWYPHRLFFFSFSGKRSFYLPPQSSTMETLDARLKNNKQADPSEPIFTDPTLFECRR